MSFISEVWMKTTVLIERQIEYKQMPSGTGFLVGRRVSEDGHQQIFLITNKHVLGSQRRFGQQLTLRLNIGTGEELTPHTVNFTYSPESIIDHPIEAVDVCAVHVTQVAIEVPNLAFATVDYDSMAFADRIREFDIGPGDDILSLGCPLGYSQGSNNLPIVRQGLLATSLLYDISGDAADSTLPLPAYLVDGGVVHGSSGSPMILKPVIGRNIRGTVQMGNTAPFLLGILAQTRLATIPENAEPTYAGLGLAGATFLRSDGVAT
jgi:hypothetical protein